MYPVLSITQKNSSRKSVVSCLAIHKVSLINIAENLVYNCYFFIVYSSSTTLSKGKKVTITDESGKELFAYVPSKNLKAIIDVGASTSEKNTMTMMMMIGGGIYSSAMEINRII